ncbi:hypothetical protein HMPREF1547_01280 [Blautia sp. KLE 1732]|nr:hypothetical protein HMPREF1547_01280 [Blautia sp. KLE 1732]
MGWYRRSHSVPCEGFGWLIFLSIKRDCKCSVRFMGQKSELEGFRIAVAA